MKPPRSQETSAKASGSTVRTPRPKHTKPSPKTAEKFSRKNARTLPSLPSTIDDAEMKMKMACEKARQQQAAKKQACAKHGRTAKAKAKARAKGNRGKNNKKVQKSPAARVKALLEKEVKPSKGKEDKEKDETEKKEKDKKEKEKEQKEKEEKEKEEKEKEEKETGNHAAKPGTDQLSRSMSQQVLMALRRASTADKIAEEGQQPQAIVDAKTQHNRRNRFYRSLGSPLARTMYTST